MKIEARVLAAVLLILVGLELTMRLTESSLSLDLSHVQQIPLIAQQFDNGNSGGQEGILFLGNSLTRCGVDVDAFQREWQAQGAPPLQVARVMPDNSVLTDWYYMFKSHFADADQVPKVLVVGFQGGQLRDAPSHTPIRLARFYCAANNLPELMTSDLTCFDERADCLMARASSMYANRDRVRRRLLDWLVPHYRAAAQRINRSQNAIASERSAADDVSYDRLRRLVQLARENGVHVILLAIPVASEYRIDHQLLDVVQELEIELIDGREAPGITADMYPDGQHMNPAAAAVFSRFLARRIGAAGPHPSASASVPIRQAGFAVGR